MSGIEICGMVFDIPTKDDLTRWNYREWKEAKSKYREFWAETYEESEKSKSRVCCCIVMKNGTSATLDGKKLKDSDLENAKRMFQTIDELL